MPSTRLYDVDQTFYVPHFEVFIEGEQLNEDVTLDVMQVTYTDKVNEIDSFNIQVNNWDAERFRPKYEPPAVDGAPTVFDPGARVRLDMGYFNELVTMLNGEITTLEIDFPEAGGPTLSVRGLNVLHRFRAEQHTWAWENMRDSDIALWFGRRNPRRGEPGLGITVRTNPLPEEQAETYVLMDNQFDILFLLERARRHNYEVVLRRDPASSEEYLYFGPSEVRDQPPTYRLEWGKSLISFQPTLTTTNQISEVCVHGWDRRTKRKIEECVSLAQLQPANSSERQRLTQLAQAFGSRREVITDRPVHTSGEARELARRILQGQLKEMVTASGATVGLPELRAGRKVEIEGLGPRFEGEYFVTETTHTIGNGGYRVTFKARREGPLTGAG